MAGFAAKLLQQRALIYDLRWTDKSSMSLYAIFEVEPSKHQSFLSQIDSDKTFNLKHYGKILHSGVNEPSEALKAELHQKYGMYSPK